MTREKGKTQINKIKGENGDNTNSNEIQRIIREYSGNIFK
jgi:hypothetical protein